MDRTERAIEVMERAENLGVRLEFDSGLILGKQLATADPEICAIMIEELGKYLNEVRSLLERRAQAARAKQLLGQRVLVRATARDFKS